MTVTDNRAAVPSGPLPKQPVDGRRGPCLGCGTFTHRLEPGRPNGFAVYCRSCAVERMPSR